MKTKKKNVINMLNMLYFEYCIIVSYIETGDSWYLDANKSILTTWAEATNTNEPFKW